MIKVESAVRCYEVAGAEVTGPNAPMIQVRSHWNYRDRVVLEVEGTCVTVLAQDLEAAIRNATNTGKR